METLLFTRDKADTVPTLCLQSRDKADTVPTLLKLTIYKESYNNTLMTMIEAQSLPEISEGFPGGSAVKNLPANAGDPNAGDVGSIPGSGRSLGGNGSPLQYLLPGKSHGQKSLVGYRPWGHKE